MYLATFHKSKRGKQMQDKRERRRRKTEEDTRRGCRTYQGNKAW